MKYNASVNELILQKISIKEMKNTKITFLIGAPGSEKKYFSKKLEEDFGYSVISLGKILQKEIDEVDYL